jgi:vitamin B12 transporter
MAFRFCGVGTAVWLLSATALLGGAAHAQDAPRQTPPIGPLADAGVANAPVIEVQVKGASAVERQRESAEAVKVIETTHARREAADLGEVLARAEGVSVRRMGGLGSGTRLSLNGLTDDQIRFFLDGVPLELSGHIFGIPNVPVGLADRVDVYRGVVPIRYGADALGGAVDLISDPEIKRSHALASYQTGSFGTHRLGVSGVYAHAPSGLFARLTGFLDRAANDYLIDVEAADAQGQRKRQRVHRANDRYAAVGGSVELGVAGKAWAKQLSLRAFISDFDKGMPHDVVMQNPYGRVRYGGRAYGASLRFDRRLLKGLSLQSTGGYSFDRRYFTDISTGIYDWYGRRTGTRSVGTTVTPGEIEPGGYDQRVRQHNAFARAQLSWRIAEGHQLRLALSPTFSARTGKDHQVAEGSIDRVDAPSSLWVVVTGLEYRLDAWDGRIENSLFVKDYVYRAHSDAPLIGGGREQRETDYHRGGAGDALRLRVGDDLYLKASYEWATRLPRADEVFGDGMRTSANLELLPEVSHNVNLGAAFARPTPGWGGYRAEATLFLRDADRLITQLPDRDQSQRFFKYQNISRARSLGAEAALGWTSPGDYVLIDANVTCQDFRNLSENGYYARYKGDRVPNRPWLFANGSVRLQKQAAVVTGDTLELAWYGRYVHPFFRAWESLGRRDSKDIIPAQFLHAVVLTYLVRGQRWTFGSTLELDNVTNAKAYDFFGVQRPGRAVYYKATLEL